MGSEGRQGMAALVPKRSLTVTIIIVSPVDGPASFFSDLVLSMAGDGCFGNSYILFAEVGDKK